MLGDRLARKPHLTSFLQSLRQENNELSKEREVKFAICTDTNEVAVTPLPTRPGPMSFTSWWVEASWWRACCARRSRIVMVIDPALNALGNTEAQRALQERSRGSGHRRRAGPGGQRDFLRSLIQDFVLSGLESGAALEGMSPEARGRRQAIDSELELWKKLDLTRGGITLPPACSTTWAR